MEPIRLALVLHFHQPVGNFGEVFDQAFTMCYLPLLDTLEAAEKISFTLHVTGPLLEWLAANQPDYLARLKNLAEAGRVEWMLGGFYEPILPALSGADRLGQIQMMRRWIEDHCGQSPVGCWLAERVWEPGLASTLAAAGVEYTLLDDHLIRAAGYSTDQAMRPFLVEDGGSLVKILPISERLRYLIPFQSSQDLIDELAQAQKEGGRLLIYGDDAEKFGLWPKTHEHVFGSGWLRDTLARLAEVPEIVEVCTAGEALRKSGNPTPAIIPAGSYREMEEWAAPATTPTLSKFRKLLDANEETRESAEVYLRGGSWRNFLTRYPEARRLHGRVCAASNMVRETGPMTDDEALRDVFRAQCNCSYWHGVFGGVYLTHLRDNLYRHLLLAEAKTLPKLTGFKATTTHREARDFDLDGRDELALTRENIRALIKPDLGGRLYELSHLEAAWNPLLCLSRRIEAYHREIEPEKLADNPLVADDLPRDCFVDGLVTDLPAPHTWFGGEPPLSHDLGATPYIESWCGDLLTLTTTLTLPAGGSLKLEKSLELTTTGINASYCLTPEGNPELSGYLAVECNLGPGNHGGESVLTSGDQTWQIGEAKHTELAGPVTAEAITRGDVNFNSSGATALLTGPIWSLSRDEAEVKRDLQGSCLVFFFPLEFPKIKKVTHTIQVTLKPY